VPFITVAQAQAKSRGRHGNKSIAHGALVASAQVSPSSEFDVFLSHSSLDAESIAGLALYFEEEGLSVYVDSVIDPQLSRERVTVETAALLKERMDHSQFLLYATSDSSPQSKWMPWELGYFDGSKPGKVGIIPLVRSPAAGFAGQEYRSLYPPYELIDFDEYGRRLGRTAGPQSGYLLFADVRS
jgi:hypothetical protein